MIWNNAIRLGFIIIILATGQLSGGCERHAARQYLEQGRKAGSSGDFQTSVDLLSKAISKDPKLKEAYILRGVGFEKMNQQDKAIADFATLLSFDPNNTEVLYYTGICKYEQQKFEEAIEFYNRALATKGITNRPDSSRPRLRIRMFKPGAKDGYDIPDYEIYYQRGLAYYAINQYKKAFYDFNDCIASEYNLGESYYMLGLCWLTSKNKDRACEAFNKGSVYGDSLSIVQVREGCQ